MGTNTTATKIAEALRKIGVDAEAYPVVVAAPNPNIAAELAQIAGLETCVFTSQRAAELVHQNATPNLRSTIARCSVYAIGPSTARRVRELFGAQPAVPETYSSEGLCRLLAGRNLGRTALFSSTARSEALASLLKSQSTMFFEPKLYTLTLDQAATQSFLRRAEQGGLGGVVFTCSTATGVLKGFSKTRNLRFVAMGRRTLGSLRSAGHDAHLPANSSVEHVVKLIAQLEHLL